MSGELTYCLIEKLPLELRIELEYQLAIGERNFYKLSEPIKAKGFSLTVPDVEHYLSQGKDNFAKILNRLDLIYEEINELVSKNDLYFYHYIRKLEFICQRYFELVSEGEIDGQAYVDSYKKIVKAIAEYVNHKNHEDKGA
jgi:hypothetical protein